MPLPIAKSRPYPRFVTEAARGDDGWVEAFGFSPTENPNDLRAALGSWLARRGAALSDLSDDDVRVMALPVPLSNQAGVAVSVQIRRSALGATQPPSPHG